MNICVECGTKIQDGDMLNGCPKCGNKRYKFINPNTEKRKAEKLAKSKDEEKKKKESSLDKADVESIKVEDKGIYELNLSNVLEGETEVYSSNEGQYKIDIGSLLQKKKKDD
ncbi:OapC/ArvC family zinc-ribbon domain-containing protein [Methanobrevibacter curvatus]|uniref:Zn-ribbon containing protein n=1 Tax=Methanobrevibacter curvatus TaxID=49547 RepID=A0A166AQZ6_9EURY|nr:Zn-ribbon containing protein [Methanobrevibacter curvatus]KZX12362.1 hypothetical protein MBCUR_10540 [Methanobrevibacter curvatus]